MNISKTILSGKDKHFLGELKSSNLKMPSWQMTNSKNKNN